MTSWWLDILDMLWIKTTDSKNLRVGKETPDELIPTPIWFADRSRRGLVIWKTGFGKPRRLAWLPLQHYERALWCLHSAYTTWLSDRHFNPHCASRSLHVSKQNNLLDCCPHLWDGYTSPDPACALSELWRLKWKCLVECTPKLISSLATHWIVLFAPNHHLLFNCNPEEVSDANTSKKANLPDCEMQ